MSLRALAIASVILLAALAGCEDTSAKARAQRIGTLDDTIGGPHAVGTIGDFLLENDQIRLVIADTGVSNDPGRPTTYGRVNTTYGGSLVDADLVRVGSGQQKGNDQLAELLPGLMFTVINPTEVCVPVRGTNRCPTANERAEGIALADGRDGGVAAVTVVGTGGDLLQMVSLLNTGLVFPSGLELRNTYRLAPGAHHAEIETVVTNKAPNGGAHPFPYLNPMEISNLLGGLVPNFPIELSVPMGQLSLFGGEQELFAPGFAGFNVKYRIEDTYALAGGFPGLPGMVVDFIATRGNGVSYGLAVPESPNNYVNRFATQYPGQNVTPTSMLVPFTYAGVAGVFMANPPPVLQANESFTFTSYFVVGRGDVGSVAEIIYELRGLTLGTFGGNVVDAQTSAPVARANVLVLDAQGAVINQMQTDSGGAFVTKLPVGTYRYMVIADDRVDPEPVPFVIAANQRTGIFAQLAPPATLAVTVRDEKGRDAPVKVMLIGAFASANQGDDPRDFLYSFERGERRRVTAFDGGNRYVEAVWWTRDGRLRASVRPGTYTLVVARGPEYEVTEQPITLTSGSLSEASLVLQRAFETEGWVSGDFHLHANPSTDSGVLVIDRVVSCAAEGLEVAVATDHNFVTDYAPAIAAADITEWLLGLPGVELTTFEMGHFNGYPLRIDPGSTRGGEFQWAFTPPGKLFETLRGMAVDPENAIVQVNHPRQTVLGYFSQFFINPATAEPITPAGILGVFAPYGDEFAAENFSYDFDAVELLTGNRTELLHDYVAPNPLPPGPFPDPQPVPGEVVVDSAGIPKYPGMIETWFTLIDRGHRATGMGTSDTHGLLGDEPGYARTLIWVGEDKDELGAYGREDVVRAIQQRRAITTNAPFIDIKIGDKMIGDLAPATGGGVDVQIRVRSAKWARVNKLIVYASGGQKIEQAIPQNASTDYTTTVRVSVTTRDSWVIAEVLGEANMFPIVSPIEFPPLDANVLITALSAGLDLSSLPIASKLQPPAQHPTTPYAITNPIMIDANGDGRWTPPGAPLPQAKVRTGALPDVRAQFDAFEGRTP